MGEKAATNQRKYSETAAALHGSKAKEAQAQGKLKDAELKVSQTNRLIQGIQREIVTLEKQAGADQEEQADAEKDAEGRRVHKEKRMMLRNKNKAMKRKRKPLLNRRLQPRQRWPRQRWSFKQR